MENILKEIEIWKSELDNSLEDTIIYNTLQTVEDIINEELYTQNNDLC